MFGGAYVRREICVFKIDWASLVVGRKFTIFVLFYLFCIRGQIPSTSPPGDLYSEGRFNGRFFALRFWGPYIWRVLFLEFYSMFFRVFTIKFGLFFKKKKKKKIRW